MREGALRFPARAPEGRRLIDLDALAARTPAPGGGAAAAWAVGIAAALVEMAAQFGDLPVDPGLRARALELAEEELHAYAPVLEAQRAGDPARVAEALSGAAESPLGIARLAAEVAEAGASVVAGGKESVKGDAAVGVVLAEAACRAAGRLVRINLASLPGDPRLAELADLEARAGSSLTSSK